MAKEIEFVIAPDGQIRTEATGFEGASCLNEIDKLLEGVVARDKRKVTRKSDPHAKVGVGSEIKVGR